MTDTLLQGVFVPHHVLALLPGNKRIEIVVAVHVHQADVVRSLVIVNDVGDEFTFAVVLKPCGFAAKIGAGDGIDVAGAVDIAHLQALRRGEVGVDVMKIP